MKGMEANSGGTLSHLSGGKCVTETRRAEIQLTPRSGMMRLQQQRVFKQEEDGFNDRLKREQGSGKLAELYNWSTENKRKLQQMWPWMPRRCGKAKRDIMGFLRIIIANHCELDRGIIRHMFLTASSYGVV